MKKTIKDKHLGLMIDSEMHYKLNYIAAYEGRSVSGQIMYQLRKSIREFEAENGTIKFPVE